MKALKWFLGSLVALVGIAIFAGHVAANGVPIKIFLDYLPEFSNYGPTDARGEAQVSIGEAWVELNAEGLPQLNGELYQAWLVSADNQTIVDVGTFNADAEGQVSYFIELESIPDVEYRYFMITVESDPDSNSEPDSRRTISGIFPIPEIQIVESTPTPTLEPSVTATPGGPPSTLPVTGMVSFEFEGLKLFGLGLGIIALGVLGLGFRWRLARKTSDDTIINSKNRNP
jgi:hypothetical protein